MRRSDLLKLAATWPDTEEKGLNLVVGRTPESPGMSLIRTASCPPVGDHYYTVRSRFHPEQSASLRDPAILFMVSQGPHRTLQEAPSTRLSVVGFSYPGADICPLCGRD